MKFVLSAMLLLAAPAIAQVQLPTAPMPSCDNKPVYMVVAGLTLDRDRMGAYAKEIQVSGLYTTLGAYYINGPRPVAVFEGAVAPTHATLIVRFSCLAHARAFWYSKTYQERIRPLRLNPSAGDYSVAVYAEAELPPYMKKRVTSRYLQSFTDRESKGTPQVDDPALPALPAAPEPPKN
jgi:uncharacterized protein (DUF1330 family)